LHPNHFRESDLIKQTSLSVSAWSAITNKVEFRSKGVSDLYQWSLNLPEQLLTSTQVEAAMAFIVSTTVFSEEWFQNIVGFSVTTFQKHYPHSVRYTGDGEWWTTQ